MLDKETKKILRHTWLRRKITGKLAKYGTACSANIYFKHTPKWKKKICEYFYKKFNKWLIKLSHKSKFK